jgi:epoxyqueuosine reductase
VVPLLVSTLEDPESLVRVHAAWALGKIGGKQAKAALEKRRRLEEDEGVRKEIESSLNDA